MSNCKQENSKMFEPVQQVNSKFDCTGIASGEVTQIVSQSNLEIERCASVMKQEKPSQDARRAKDEENLNAHDSIEVYAIILKLFVLALGFSLNLFTLVIGHGLKVFMKFFEQVHRHLGQWIQLLHNIASESDEHADSLSMDFYKSLKPRLYWICIPLTFLNLAYMMSYICLLTVKVLLFKVHVPNYLK